MKLLFLTLVLFGGIIFLFNACKVKDHPSSSGPIDHDLWDSLLQKHVKSQGQVDYKGFIADRELLEQYLQELQENHPNEENWTKNEQMAYWINAYNAFTVKIVIDYYPVESIKDIKGKIPFVNTVWDVKFINIEGAVYDLNNIEHGILRSKYKDPRIHFALNCASGSCPNLSRSAYTAESLDKQLDKAGRIFLGDPTKNIITEEEVRLSKIFQWYGSDFTKEVSKIEYLNRFAPQPIPEKTKIKYLDYDWSLNEVREKS